MRRVSTRQRLVSWDGFDAAATDEEDSDFGADEFNSIATNTTDDGGGYHTAVVDSNSCHDLLLLSSTTHVPRLVGHKRDRSSRGAGQKQKGPSSSASNLSPVATTMFTRKTIQTTSTLPGWSAPLLIPSYTWEVDHAFTVDNKDQSLKKSSSTSTLSSSVSTSSTILTSSPFCTTAPPPISVDSLDFNQLMKDVHIAISAFLDLQSLQNMMAVNTQYRQLVVSNDVRTCLWSQHCQDK